MWSWQSFIGANWVALAAGKKIWVTLHPHQHPRLSPLFKANTGWPVGQHSDYTASYRDGSRIHVQCFGPENGLLRMRLHRDQFDPDQSPLHFLLHGLLETPAGPLLAVAALVGGGLRMSKLM